MWKAYKISSTFNTWSFYRCNTIWRLLWGLKKKALVFLGYGFTIIHRLVENKHRTAVCALPQKQTRGHPETGMCILACMLGSCQLDFHLCSSNSFPFNIYVENKMLHSLFRTRLFLSYFYQSYGLRWLIHYFSPLSLLLGRSLHVPTTEKFMFWAGLSKGLWLCQAFPFFCFLKEQTKTVMVLTCCDKW